MRLHILRFLYLFFQIRLIKHTQLGIFVFRSAIRDRTRKPVHLPDIPGNNIRHLKIFGKRRLSFEPRLQILLKSHQQIDAGNQYIVALKFIPVGRFQRSVRPFQPIFFSCRELIDDPELPVKDTDAVFNRDRLSALHVITRCKVGGLSASNFHAPGIDVLLPGFFRRNFYMFRRLIPLKKHIRVIKPNLIRVIVHLFHDPQRSKHFRMLFCPQRLLFHRFARPCFDHVSIAARNQILCYFTVSVVCLA